MSKLRITKGSDKKKLSLNDFKLFYQQIDFENDQFDNHKMLNIGTDNRPGR